MELHSEETAPDWWENTMDMAILCSLEKQSDGTTLVVLQYGTKGDKPGELVSQTIFWQAHLDGWDAADPDDGAPADIAAIGLIAMQQLLEGNGIDPSSR